ncbi:MAG: ATP-binding protein [Bacteroidales bacterium]|nr:ATP-binding protein [Bacteroidales bacterium]
MEKLIIQSDIDKLPEVERFVDAVCDTYNINNYVATISMSLLQAVKNAIVHGNGSNPEKHVTIESDFCKGGVYFKVSDEGQGFDFKRYGAMPDQEEQGMGIYLMRTLSDKMTFTDNGRAVCLEYVIDGIEASRALERIMTLHNFYSPKMVNA